MDPIAPLEELVRLIEEWRDRTTRGQWSAGAVRQVHNRADALESLLPALTSRFEALETEIAARKEPRRWASLK